jgi:hypothetical protein
MDPDKAVFKKSFDICTVAPFASCLNNVVVITKLQATNAIYISSMTYTIQLLLVCSGALTHSVKALDISLKIDTELALLVGRRTKRA